MTNLHAIICSRVPQGARAHRLNLNALTDELKWLARCKGAWAIWVGPHCVGILAHNTQTGFSWARRSDDGTFKAPPFIHSLSEAVSSMVLDTDFLLTRGNRGLR